MDAWTLVRWLHLLAMALFVGGQLLLLVAVPVVRRRLAPLLAVPVASAPAEGVLRGIARAFGAASGVALIVLLATGVAMAAHFERWGVGTLTAKLVLVGLVLALIPLHAVAPRSRLLTGAVLLLSLLIVWLGVELAH